MAKLFANSGDPDQTLHSAVSDLGLHCLPELPFYGSPTTMGYINHAKITLQVYTCIQCNYSKCPEG